MAVNCPECGTAISVYRTPVPTVDIIIEQDGCIVLVERKNEPFGWALPGGFVDYGETVEDAARREAMEETGLDLEDLALFGVYSDPARDPRQHNLSITFTARGSGRLAAGDDAANVKLFAPGNLPAQLCFDHAEIIAEYVKTLQD